MRFADIFNIIATKRLRWFGHVSRSVTQLKPIKAAAYDYALIYCNVRNKKAKFNQDAKLIAE